MQQICIPFRCPGPYIARGEEGGQLPPPAKPFFFSNIVFEFAVLFLVAILVRNHKEIDLLSEKKHSFTVNSK